VQKERISTVQDTFSFISPEKSPVDVIESFRRFYGPTMNAFEAAEKNAKAGELQDQLVELAKLHDKSTDGGTAIGATFLRVTVRL
jgi:hypothetical protein